MWQNPLISHKNKKAREKFTKARLKKKDFQMNPNLTWMECDGRVFL